MVELHDLAAPYALDALDAVERQKYEAHLATCGRCRREVAELTETTAGLAQSVASDPPPHLKEAVMEATAPVALPTGTLTARRRVAGWLAAAAASAIAIVFLGLWVVTSGDLDQANRVAAVYEAPDATFVDIESPQGAARFVYSPSLQTGVFNGGELDSLSEEDIYQLWLVEGDAIASAGVFEAGDEAVLVEAVPPGVTLAMTIELSPGVDAPTSDPLFAEEI